MPFQSQVYDGPVAALEGDYADSNARFFASAGPFGLVAGPAGVSTGRFAWLSDDYVDANGAPSCVNNFGAGVVGGFIPRRQQALITAYLAESTILIPAGFMVEMMTGGGIWVKNYGSTQAVYGSQCYATYGNGQATFASGSAASGTASSITSTNSTFTGSITGNIMTVTSGSPGVIIGSTLSGTGGNAIATGTLVLYQLTGPAGGVGTYAVSIPEQAVTSCTITQTYGLFTAGGTITGAFALGQVLSGPGGGNAVTTGTTINGFGTGTGGAGTYYVTVPTGGNTTSSTISAATNIATPWYAVSSGLQNEMVKCTHHYNI